jgi:hypothetical protein
VHDSKPYFTSVVFHAYIQFGNGTNPHTEIPHRSPYRADIMSATRSSTVCITPTATGRGLAVATTVEPVEASGLQDAGVRRHEYVT